MEYRITVMHGDIEKQLCMNNTIQEVNGFLQVQLSGNKLQDKLKTQIAKALGNIIGKTVKEVDRPGETTNEKMQAKDGPVALNNKASGNSKESN